MMGLWFAAVNQVNAIMCVVQRLDRVKWNLLGRMYDQMDITGQPLRFIQIGTQERGRIRKEIDAMLNSMLCRKER